MNLFVVSLAFMYIIKFIKTLKYKSLNLFFYRIFTQRATRTNMHNDTFITIQFKLPFIRLIIHLHIIITNYNCSRVAVQIPDINSLTSSAYISTFAKLNQSGRSLANNYICRSGSMTEH